MLRCITALAACCCTAMATARPAAASASCCGLGLLGPDASQRGLPGGGVRRAVSASARCCAAACRACQREASPAVGCSVSSLPCDGQAGMMCWFLHICIAYRYSAGE